MKLSISNIAWSQDLDDAIYNLLQSEGLDGIEIAPTRIYPEAPYSHTDDAVAWSSQLSKKYQLAVSSMQSIWYGRTENLFRSVQERTALLDYTKMAIDFAAAINCHNLVFGCPRNRNMDASCVFPIPLIFFMN
jgi:sugar phosphate isomerase/epimerase